LATVEDSEVAAIVGATVGGVAVLLCLGGALCLAQRRRQRKRAGELSRSTEEWRAESDSGESHGQRSGSKSDEEAAPRKLASHSSISESEWDKFTPISRGGASARKRNARGQEAAVNRFTLIPWGRCSLGGFIGSGTSGDVYSATYASTQVACKLLRKRNINNRDMQLLVEECELGLRLRHPNVLLMIGLTSDRAMNHGVPPRHLSSL